MPLGEERGKEVQECIPDKGMDEIDRIAGLAEPGEDPVGKAFETKGGLIEGKTDEDADGGEDNPGHPGDNICRCRVKEQECQAGG
jgi:hypothetical protein